MYELGQRCDIASLMLDLRHQGGSLTQDWGMRLMMIKLNLVNCSLKVQRKNNQTQMKETAKCIKEFMFEIIILISLNNCCLEALIN